MITYLLTTYPVFYFILSVCFIVTGTALLFTLPTQVRHLSERSTGYDLTDGLFLQFVIMSGVIDDLHRSLVIHNKFLCLQCDYAILFEVQKPQSLNELKTLKDNYHKNQETIVVISNKSIEQINEEPVYTDVKDIIRMKMNLLSCA